MKAGKSIKARRLAAQVPTKRSKLKLELGAPEPHERDAAAFWGRRLATTLAVGNGAGVVAISSYISNAKDLSSAATLAYPSMAAFLAGAMAAFLSFFASLLWSSFRLDAYLEFFTNLSKSKISLSREHVEAKIAATIFSILLIIVQISVLTYSCWKFYEGTTFVVYGLANSACSSKVGSLCDRDIAFMYPSDARGDFGFLNKAGVVGRLNRFQSKITYQKFGASGTLFPQRIDIQKSGAPVKYETGVSQRIRIVATPEVGDEAECVVNFNDYYIGSSSPFLINSHAKLFMNMDGKKIGKFYISIVPLYAEFTVSYEEGGIKDFSDLRVYTGGGDSGVEMRDIEVSTGPSIRTFSRGPTHALFFPERNKKPDSGCRSVVDIMGMEEVEWRKS